MRVNRENKFEAPIPGEGMTIELGSRPWQNPPAMTTVEDAIEFYINRMTNEDFYYRLMDVVEMGVPLATVIDSMQTYGMMEGLHSADVGILVSPVLLEYAMYLCELSNVKYEDGLTEPDTEELPEATIRAAVNRAQKEVGSIVIEDEFEEDDSEQKGLMARREKSSEDAE